MFCDGLLDFLRTFPRSCHKLVQNSAVTMQGGNLSDGKLTKIHVCRQCNPPFLFDSEMTEYQAATGHMGIFEITFGIDESLELTLTGTNYNYLCIIVALISPDRTRAP
jgi:hypothetical protein